MFAVRNNPIADSVGWLTGTLLGDLATTLCVLAVAFVGLSMLGGRMPIREGGRVILGCFVLLGAPVIAASFIQPWSERHTMVEVALPPQIEMLSEREELPPAQYDPYAGASLRRSGGYSQEY